MTEFRIAFTRRFITLTLCALATAYLAFLLVFIALTPLLMALFFVFLALTALGFHDLYQTKHAILRNYPIAAHLRFLLEEIRPEMRQYFFEDAHDAMPFGRNKRSLVYQRAKMQLDKQPFGTSYDTNADGYEWMTHSMVPQTVPVGYQRVTIGGPDCAQPYSASLYNISAMSFGALSPNAIRALNKGAALGGFAHDTGEGSFSVYHAENGGDIIWEIGSGYFGARTPEGAFSPETFAKTVANPQIKMVELKLSQGAKPGHGGVLPGAKVTAEIAAARGVALGEDCISPPNHSTFSTPVEMMRFIAELRRLSHGKPTGFKLCIGHEWEFLALCKAMLETEIYPDFIVIDGTEGGTGAAPVEFMDHLGKPMREGLNFVHSSLVGLGIRDRIKLGVSGKIITAFDIARAMALGADWCNAARGFMFAIGCIQSQSCHTDRCPTGVATQDPSRQRALVVEDKAQRVANFHKATMHCLAELTSAVGLNHPSGFSPHFFSRRISQREVLTFAELYPVLAPGDLLRGTTNPRYAAAWNAADAHSFRPRA